MPFWYGIKTSRTSEEDKVDRRMICCKEASAETKAYRAGSFTSHWIKLLPPLLFCVRHTMLSRFISVALRLLVAHSDQKRKEVLSGSEWFPNNCQSFKLWFGCASWHTEAQHMHLVYRAVVLLFILTKIPPNCIIFTLCGLLVDLSLIFYWLCKVVSTNNAYTAVCVCGAWGETPHYYYYHDDQWLQSTECLVFFFPLQPPKKDTKQSSSKPKDKPSGGGGKAKKKV